MRRPLFALALATLVAAGACGADPTEDTAGAAGSPSPSPSPSASPSVIPTIDPQGEICQRVGDMEARLVALRGVELTLPNRTSLEIELDKLQAAHIELERTEMGDREDELGDSLTRLGYRMGELKLAVEDFRTNPKPRRAVTHVEDDTQKVVDELNAFVVLSGC